MNALVRQRGRGRGGEIKPAPPTIPTIHGPPSWLEGRSDSILHGRGFLIVLGLVQGGKEGGHVAVSADDTAVDPTKPV